MLGDLEDSTSLSATEIDEDATENSAVAKLMNQIITDAIRQGAGDIYIEPHETEVRVRFRIDGVCMEVMTAPEEDPSSAHQPAQDQLGHGHRRAPDTP